MKKVVPGFVFLFILKFSAFAQCDTAISYGAALTGVSCSYNCDGSVFLTVSGGDSSGFYTYNWTDGETTSSVTDLCSGIAYCTVSDGGACSVVAGPFDIIAPAAIDIYNVSTPDTNCTGPYNGCINWIVSGGDGNYTFSNWGSGGTGLSDCTLSNGTYNVTVTDGAGCTASSGTSVGFAGAITVNLGNDTTLCGSIVLDARNPGDSYSWSNTETTESITANLSNNYGVTVTNPATGCTASADVNVNILFTPPVNLGTGISQCGGTVTLDAGNPGSSYIWSNDSANEVIEVATSGLYSVTVTNGSGCSASSSANVYINPVPHVNIGSDTTFCGGSFVLNADNPGDLYLWSTGATTQTISVNLSNSYNVTVTDPNSGCTAESGLSILFYPVPVVNLGTGITQCGGPVTLHAGNPGSSYAWSNDSSGEFISVAFSGFYSVTVTDNLGCSASSSVDVYIQPVPYVNLGNDTSLCGSLSLDAGNPGDSYLWSTGATTQTISVSSSDTISVTVTDPGGGCAVADSIIVLIKPVPSVNLGPDINQCGGGDTLYAGNPGDSYSWSDASGGETVFASTTGLYSVTVTNPQGCSASSSVNVYIQAMPSVYLGPAQRQCGGTVLLDAANTGYRYLWSPAAGGATTQTVAVSASGEYAVTVTSPVDGCTASDSINITIDSLPVVSLGADTTRCGGSVTLYANNTGSAFLWSDNSTNDSLVVTSSGIYRVTVTNFNGCSATGSIGVTINPIPAVTLSLSPNICITLPPFTISGGSPVGGTYYEADSTITSFAPYQQGIGFHTITYVYSNTFGCVDSASDSSYVWPQPFITTLSLPYLCPAYPEINMNDYFDPPGGKYSGIGVSGSFFYPNLIPPGPDTIIDIYTDSLGCMDTSSYPVLVHFPVHVDLNSSVADFTICANQSITFTATGAMNYQFFVNDSSQGSASTNNVFTTTTLSNHSFVTVVGSDSCSSDTSEPIVIDVIAPPVVSAGNDTTITLGQSVELNGSATGAGGFTYLWAPDTGLNFTTVPNPTYSGSDSITFWFKVTDHYGCLDSASVRVNVYVPNNVQLPNVITPNGDGYNDVWKLNAKINLDGSHLIVFDRWGEKVYETENYANNWGGTYLSTGKLLPDDTYYYVLKVPAQDNHVYEGPINVISGSNK